MLFCLHLAIVTQSLLMAITKAGVNKPTKVKRQMHKFQNVQLISVYYQLLQGFNAWKVVDTLGQNKDSKKKYRLFLIILLQWQTISAVIGLPVLQWYATYEKHTYEFQFEPPLF